MIETLLGGLLGALGGAGFLGFLSEYATYNYAIHYGFRPPLEGIPYLKATVTLGSFLLLITGAVVFLLSLLIVRLVVWSLEFWLSWSFRLTKRLMKARNSPLDRYRTVFERLSHRPAWQVLLVALIVAAVTGVFTYFEFRLLFEYGPRQNTKLMPVTIVLAAAAYTFILTLAMTYRKAIWWLGGIATFGYFVAWLWMLFSPSWYANFLRTVGYGGGLPIAVELRDPQHAGNSDPIKCFLLLRTTEALLILPVTGQEVVEIPRDQVRMIRHDGGGLRLLPYRLPDEGISK